MKKTLMALLLAGACAAPSLANAATPYASVSAGLSIPGNSNIDPTGTITFKNGMPWGGALGLKGEEYRIEAALGYQVNHVDTSTVAMASGSRVDMFSYMANIYYDYELDWNVSPYLMGGAGATSFTHKAPNVADVTKSVFTWQVGVGVGVKATENVTVDLGYRYFKPGAYTLTDTAYGNAKRTASSSNIMLGLRYDF